MKVEQVVVSKADIDESTKLQEEMVAISEEIHRDLKLPYRKLQICTGDMPAGKYRAFDLEAWSSRRLAQVERALDGWVTADKISRHAISRTIAPFRWSRCTVCTMH